MWRARIARAPVQYCDTMDEHVCRTTGHNTRVGLCTTDQLAGVARRSKHKTNDNRHICDCIACTLARRMCGYWPAAHMQSRQLSLRQRATLLVIGNSDWRRLRQLQQRSSLRVFVAHLHMCEGRCSASSHCVRLCIFVRPYTVGDSLLLWCLSR
jgi:hypothetical protein